MDGYANNQFVLIKKMGSKLIAFLLLLSFLCMSVMSVYAEDGESSVEHGSGQDSLPFKSDKKKKKKRMHKGMSLQDLEKQIVDDSTKIPEGGGITPSGLRDELEDKPREPEAPVGGPIHVDHEKNFLQYTVEDRLNAIQAERDKLQAQNGGDNSPVLPDGGEQHQQALDADQNLWAARKEEWRTAYPQQQMDAMTDNRRKQRLTRFEEIKRRDNIQVSLIEAAEEDKAQHQKELDADQNFWTAMKEEWRVEYPKQQAREANQRHQKALEADQNLWAARKEEWRVEYPKQQAREVNQRHQKALEVDQNLWAARKEEWRTAYPQQQMDAMTDNRRKQRLARFAEIKRRDNIQASLTEKAEAAKAQHQKELEADQNLWTARKEEWRRAYPQQQMDMMEDNRRKQRLARFAEIKRRDNIQASLTEAAKAQHQKALDADQNLWAAKKEEWRTAYPQQQMGAMEDNRRKQRLARFAEIKRRDNIQACVSEETQRRVLEEKKRLAREKRIQKKRQQLSEEWVKNSSAAPSRKDEPARYKTLMIDAMEAAREREAAKTHQLVQDETEWADPAMVDGEILHSASNYLDGRGGRRSSNDEDVREEQDVILITPVKEGEKPEQELVVEEAGKESVTEKGIAEDSVIDSETTVATLEENAVEAYVAAVPVEPVYDSALVAAMPATAVETVNHTTMQLFSGHHRTITDFRMAGRSAGAGIERLDVSETSATASDSSNLALNGLYSYMRAFGGQATAKSYQNLPGYNARGYGFETGLFRVVSEELLVGMMMAGQHNKASLNGVNGSIDMTSLRLGPFFSWQRGNVHIDGALTVGHHDVGAMGRDRLTGQKYKGRFSMNDWAAWMGTGYDIHLDSVVPGLTLTPVAEFQYMDTRVSGFDLKHHGKDQVKVHGGSRHDRVDRFGVLLDYQAPGLRYETSIRGGAGVQQNHFADHKASTRYVGGSRQVTEERRARDRKLNWYTLGVNSRLDEARSVSFDLEGTKGRSTRSYGAAATFEYRFK